MTLTKRASGILLHVTSLPSAFGIGDLGPESYDFVDLLSRGKQCYWSILPFNPANSDEGNSPYKADSAFAGNPLLISPELLVDKNLLSKEQIEDVHFPVSDKVNYGTVQAAKFALFEKAFQVFQRSKKKELTSGYDFDAFCLEMSSWLEDYTLYKALRLKSGKPWFLWPESLRKREPKLS